ncbi:DNA (cytosine-5)-methyltransferase 4, partial [Amborella trichopoda]|uniref:DNA (cytosine-5)-methyltransferase 4 n=1 Tax=Amborella trichopoda TaxID=13333 RepID=UPI0009C061FA
MEDSFVSPKNKRKRSVSPQGRKRRLSWTDSEIISGPIAPSSTSMEESEPTITSCSGSQENLETIPGLLSGLEGKEGHVHGFCSASEEKPQAMKASGKRAASTDLPYGSSKRVKPISVDPLNFKETDASLSGAAMSLLTSGATKTSSTGQGNEPKSLVERNVGSSSASKPSKDSDSNENPDLTIQEEQRSQEKLEGEDQELEGEEEVGEGKGVVIPFEGCTSENLRFRCGPFGPVRSWCITGFRGMFLSIWVSTGLADYLCVMPRESYFHYYSCFKFKASLCFRTFQELTLDKEVEFGDLLSLLALNMLDDCPGYADFNLMSDAAKPHMAFVADQLVALDEHFSEFKVIKMINEEFKEDMEKIRILRQANMVSGRKFSGSFYSIQNCNEEFTKASSKDNDGEKARRGATSSQTSLEEEKHHPPKKQSLPTIIESQEKNIETIKKTALDVRKKTEEIEVVNDEYVAVSITGTTNSKTTKDQRRLKGFEMLDKGEVMQPFENLEADRMYITSEIWTSYNSEEPDLGVRCKSFGPALSWCITGYEKEAPEIWVSTEMADYLCQKPSADYMPFFKPFYEKAMLCIQAFHVICATPDLEFDEFCRKLVLDIFPCFDTFKDEETTWNYVNSNLGFVAEQLIGLDGIVFSEITSIKSIVHKCNVDVAKALDRKACGSFLSLDDKNWRIQQCQSAETRKKPEIDIPQVWNSGTSNPAFKRWKKEKAKRERKKQPLPQLKSCEDLAKEDVGFTKTKLGYNIWTDYHSKKMGREESMDVEHGKPGTMEHDKTEVGKEVTTMELEHVKPESRMGCRQEESGEVEHGKPESTMEIRKEQSMEVEHDKPVSGPKTSEKMVMWIKAPIHDPVSGDMLFGGASLNGETLSVKEVALVKENGCDILVLVQYMYQRSDESNMAHGRVLVKGCDTFLGNAANPKEVFLNERCIDFKLENVKRKVKLDLRLVPHKKDESAEFFCGNVYLKENRAFLRIQKKELEQAMGKCSVCTEREALVPLKLERGDYVYVKAVFWGYDDIKRPHVVCEVLNVYEEASPSSRINEVWMEVRRFYRPEDISAKTSYEADLRE